MKKVVLILLVVLPVMALAQNYTAEQANQFFQKSDWANVVKAYSEIVKKEASNNMAWFRLARGLHETGKYQEALDAMQKAEAAGFQGMALFIRKAEVLARLNRGAEALAFLETAANQGFNQPSTLKDDPDFASLLKDEKFASILKTVERNEKPCSFDPEFRQFDFWVGEWNVSVNGNHAGVNKVELILKDCVIVENWTSANFAYNGKSYNVYNNGLKKWQQFYVDDAAGPTLYTGEYNEKDKQMRFEAETVQRDGTKLLLKMTFFNLGPDKIRQLIQQSTDNGKTWGPMFDGEYTRKK